MAEITEEQFRLANRLMLDHGYAISGSLYKKLIAILQLPWDEPTSDEALKAEEYMRRYGSSWSSVKFVLMEFVNRRNVALMPKPVDPRLYILYPLLNEVGALKPGDEMRQIAEKIIAALDEVK
jgi:hypothetical protein